MVYSNRDPDQKIGKLLLWPDLPNYTKKRKFQMEVIFKVHTEGLIGAEPNFARYLSPFDHVFLVDDMRVLVHKEVGSGKFWMAYFCV